MSDAKPSIHFNILDRVIEEWKFVVDKWSLLQIEENLVVIDSNEDYPLLFPLKPFIEDNRNDEDDNTRRRRTHFSRIASTLSHDKTTPQIDEKIRDLPLRIVFLWKGSIEEEEERMNYHLEHFSSTNKRMKCLIFSPFRPSFLFRSSSNEDTEEEEWKESLKNFKSKLEKKCGEVDLEWTPLLSILPFSNRVGMISGKEDYFPSMDKDQPFGSPSLSRNIAESIHSLFNLFHLKEDVFALGESSKSVAKAIQHINRSSNESNTTKEKNGTLIIIDRVFIFLYLSVISHLIHFETQTLDLASVCIHSENCVDRSISNSNDENNSSPLSSNMSSFLPPIPEDLLDDAPNIIKESKLLNQTEINSSLSRDKLELFTNKHSSLIFQSLLHKREKEALQDIRKKLVDILTSEKIKFVMPKVIIRHFPSI